MPASATLEELKAVDEKLKKLNEDMPEAFEKFVTFIKENRRIGYKNMIKMMLDEASPEKLKGVEQVSNNE